MQSCLNLAYYIGKRKLSSLALINPQQGQNVTLNFIIPPPPLQEEFKKQNEKKNPGYKYVQEEERINKNKQRNNITEGCI